MRRAGSGLLPEGTRVTWTVADGARGRRWRAVLLDDRAVLAALLLETHPDGSVGKLELTTPAGLLSLHPAGRLLHGNVVRPGGIEHLALPWADDRILLTTGTPVTAPAAAGHLRRALGVGEGRAIRGVLVHPDLEVREATFRVARVGPRGWRFVVADTGAETGVTLDLEGLPSLAHGVDWPLELDAGA